MAAHAPLAVPTLAAYLPAGLTAGEPDRVGALLLFPLRGAPGRDGYVTLADALGRGAELRECTPPAVNRLRLVTPPDLRVLVFPGEEIVGAKQNRIVNATVVADGGTITELPVSCIEQGRWTPGGESQAFRTSQQFAYTSLRNRVSGMVTASRTLGRSYDTDQGGVWREVAKRTTLRGVHSQTGSMTAIFEAERRNLDEATSHVAPREGQIGLLAYVAGRLLSLDLVSRPEAWRVIHHRVVRAHALEELGAQSAASSVVVDPRPLLQLLPNLAVTRSPAPCGVGEELRVGPRHATGAGVLLDGELVQLSVFPLAA